LFFPYHYCILVENIQIVKGKCVTTTPANPNVKAFRESAQKSYAELNLLMNGPLPRLETSKLYTSPAVNEWTIMQNLAHIVELMPYWAGEIEKLVTEPGRNFGRTQQDEGRLRGISEHEMDSLEEVKASLPGSYARLDEVLRSMKDSDLELTGRHIKYGEKPLGWFIEEFVTGHLRGHVEQIKRSLDAVG
jgi:DinB superfamily